MALIINALYENIAESGEMPEFDRHQNVHVVYEKYNSLYWVVEMGRGTGRYHFVSTRIIDHLISSSAKYRELKAENEDLKSKLQAITTIIGS